MSEDYFHYLYEEIAPGDIPYLKLARQLWETTFVWRVSNDDDRAADARMLREEYEERRTSAGLDPTIEGPVPCSFLEMLIGLSRRAEFIDGGQAIFWFWTMLNNIGIAHYDDGRYNDYVTDRVEKAVDTVIRRRYSYNGNGSLFPIKGVVNKDRKVVDLSRQFYDYLLDGGDDGPGLLHPSREQEQEPSRDLP